MPATPIKTYSCLYCIIFLAWFPFCIGFSIEIRLVSKIVSEILLLMPAEDPAPGKQPATDPAPAKQPEAAQEPSPGPTSSAASASASPVPAPAPGQQVLHC